jgi:hypothetical protein
VERIEEKLLDYVSKQHHRHIQSKFVTTIKPKSRRIIQNVVPYTINRVLARKRMVKFQTKIQVAVQKLHALIQYEWMKKTGNYAMMSKNWAVNFNISHEATKSLIHIINNRLPNTLPKNLRTFLNTEITKTISPVGTGQSWYNGLIKSLKCCLQIIDDDLS